jgi:hypothetical protein
VLIAFLVSALLAWITTFCYLILQPRDKEKRHNPVDEWWTKNICLPVRQHVRQPELWAECFFRVTFTLSDQQLVTGIAILVASFKLLREGKITAYHFGVARDLAFFSSNAHLLSLLALWTSLGSERKSLNRTGVRRRFLVPFVTKLRFFCMLIVMGLLMAATWQSSYRLWDDWANCPARCIPTGKRDLGGQPLKWAIASTYFLVTQYSFYAMNIGEKILGRAENLRARTRRANKKVELSLKNYRVILILYRRLCNIAMGWRYYNFSEFIELLEMMAWFCANCYWVSQNRALAKDIFGNTESGRKELAKESEWGFGQIVPVLLLMLPIMTFIGTYHGKSNRPK